MTLVRLVCESLRAPAGKRRIRLSRLRSSKVSLVGRARGPELEEHPAGRDRPATINPSRRNAFRVIRSFDGTEPDIHESAYVDPAAVVIGDVTLEAEASVWPNVTLRGDHSPIVLEEGVNV